MPQDSVYTIHNLADSSGLPDTVNASLNGLPDSIKSLLLAAQQNVSSNTDDNYPNLGLAIIIYLSIILAVIVIPIIASYIRSQITLRKKVREYESKKVMFDHMLLHYNPYYSSLEAQDRMRFVGRVIRFMSSKEFKYIDIEPEEMMPILISGAAVQLTFGLGTYLLDYFKTIYVLRDNYTYGLYNTPFEGHVNDDGIYLSWNNFITEYSNYNDGQNVGLHELAHALTYVNFTVHEGMDKNFHDKFKEFSLIARPVFEGMQSGQTNLLDKYAATDYQEFWAVCVETFFERSEEFRKQLPDLYFAICHLLNQDPLTPGKIISLAETA